MVAVLMADNWVGESLHSFHHVGSGIEFRLSILAVVLVYHVIDTMTQSSLGKKGFISFYNLKSIIQGSQSRNRNLGAGADGSHGGCC